jgi:flagellar FliL protein
VAAFAPSEASQSSGKSNAKGDTMSEDAVQGAEETTETPAKARGKGIFLVIKPLGIVAVIVVVEVVAASMLAPSAQETEKLAQQFVAASEGRAAAASEGEGHGDSHEAAHDVRELELGVYNITRFNPTTSTTLAIDFELYGVVLADEATEFQHLFEKCQARVREQVTMSLHSATSADLTEAGLTLIKRRILEKTNHALGQPLVKEVLMTKFNFVER